MENSARAGRSPCSFVPDKQHSTSFPLGYGRHYEQQDFYVRFALPINWDSNLTGADCAVSRQSERLTSSTYSAASLVSYTVPGRDLQVLYAR